MRKTFSFILFIILLHSSATFAQITVTDETAAAVDEQARQDSIQAAHAFDDILSTSYTTEDDAAGNPEFGNSSSSANADSEISSSSQGNGGLVLYDAQSSSSERRKYSKDAPMYRFMASVGLRSPSRGIASLEYIVSQELLNVGVHFTDYDSDYTLWGATITYYPMESHYFYAFLTADWFHGEYDRERRVKDDYEDYTEKVNYWRTVIGVGGEVFFMEHFGAYVEAGFEFYAGNGGYYLHCGKGSGNLNNDSFKLPYGFGLLFPF